jgi:hypothetical protein
VGGKTIFGKDVGNGKIKIVVGYTYYNRGQLVAKKNKINGIATEFTWSKHKWEEWLHVNIFYGGWRERKHTHKKKYTTAEE